MTPSDFSHLDQNGSARMVDVSEKAITTRRACATATVRLGAKTAQQVRSMEIGKGDVLQVARLAGITAAKRTDELIPLCHTLPLHGVEVDFSWIGDERLQIRATASASAKTGVEMEAMVAASIAAITVYDMCKSANKGIEIENIALEFKTGGKSGDWQRARQQ